MRNRDYTIVFISFCILHLSTLSEGRPLRKRTVSEVQLMHNVGEHKQVQERREWLQMRLRGIHTAAARGSSGEVGRTRRRLRLDEFPDLTPEEIQYALNFLEKLLKSKHS
ncbi:parathyroid hormone [Lates japonicus]